MKINPHYTGCPTTYQTRHFFNNSKTNEDIATRFEQEYVRCVRNEEKCVCSVCLFRCNIFIGFRIIKEMTGLVGSGTPYTYRLGLYCAVNTPCLGYKNQLHNYLQIKSRCMF